MAKKFIFIAASLLLVILNTEALAQRTYNTQRVKIGFYNTQNLFDTINQPMVRDGAYTPQGQKQWNSAKYNEKLGRLAHVIDQIDCDIVGLCEVENYGVVKDLTRITSNKNFSVEHYESTDFRGIDQALIYDTTKFRIMASELVPTATHKPKRGILRVQMQSKINGSKIVFYVAHLPSKLGGEKAAKSRDTIINQFSSLHKVEMQRIQGDRAKRGEKKGETVIILGDMNNDPIEVQGMVNLATPLEKMGVGTYLYRRVWSMLDQALVCEGSNVSELSTKRPDNIKINGKAVRASDHFPIYFYLDL